MHSYTPSGCEDDEVDMILIQRICPGFEALIQQSQVDVELGDSLIYIFDAKMRHSISRPYEISVYNVSLPGGFAVY